MFKLSELQTTCIFAECKIIKWRPCTDLPSLFVRKAYCDEQHREYGSLYRTQACITKGNTQKTAAISEKCPDIWSTGIL
jgi:hypothetical protein